MAEGGLAVAKTGGENLNYGATTGANCQQFNAPLTFQFLDPGGVGDTATRLVSRLFSLHANPSKARKWCIGLVIQFLCLAIAAGIAMGVVFAVQRSHPKTSTPVPSLPTVPSFVPPSSSESVSVATATLTNTSDSHQLVIIKTFSTIASSFDQPTSSSAPATSTLLSTTSTLLSTTSTLLSTTSTLLSTTSSLFSPSILSPLPTTTPSTSSPCSRCPGWTCTTYNDCSDPFPCHTTSGISGTCASTASTVSPLITTTPSTSSPCSRCPGWPCTTYNDCSDPFPCDTTSGTSGTCASTAGTV